MKRTATLEAEFKVFRSKEETYYIIKVIDEEGVLIGYIHARCFRKKSEEHMPDWDIRYSSSSTGLVANEAPLSSINMDVLRLMKSQLEEFFWSDGIENIQQGEMPPPFN